MCSLFSYLQQPNISKNQGAVTVQNQVRSMLEGALISGIFLVIMFLTLYTPIGIITTVALPIPFTVYAARHPLKNSILVVIASTLLTIFIGALPSMFTAIFAGLLGTVMGTLYYRHKTAFTVFIGGTLASLVFLLGSLLASYFFLKINPITTMQTMMEESLQMSQSLLTQFGQVDPKRVEALESMVQMIAKMIPMLLIFGSAQFSMLNHWLSRKILLRLGNPVPGFPPFREWGWPKSLLYFYVIVIALSFFIGKDTEQLSYTLFLNIKPILDVMLIIQGLSIVSYFSYRKGWGRGLFIIALVLVFIFPPFPFILMLLGIMDLGINFRKQK